MNLIELKSQLRAQPELNVVLALPDGGRVPAHYHVTEVGHVTKKFIDCGGTVRASEACVLQTYFGSPKDDGHRLPAGKLAGILDLARSILPTSDLPVEVEYEDEVISQYPLAGIVVEGDSLVLQLGEKHTDCLAKDKCGITDDETEGEGSGCCAAPTASGRCC
jgi:hypothetical protein